MSYEAINKAPLKHGYNRNTYILHKVRSEYLRAVAGMCISESILAGCVRRKRNGNVSKCIAPRPLVLNSLHELVQQGSPIGFSCSVTADPWHTGRLGPVNSYNRSRI